MDVVHMDFETCSAADLTRVGVYRYAEHPQTRIWCLSWRMNDGPVLRWGPENVEPRDLTRHVASGGCVVAHNANFERQIWNTVLRREPGRSGWPRLEIEQMDCTMARALAVHLPPDLDTLAAVLGLAVRKDSEGAALMKKMAKPRKINTDGSVLWWDAPENIARLQAYCDQDVEVETHADKVLPPLSADERELWMLDQRINDRGMALDIDMIEKCISVLRVAQDGANARMAALTGGAVSKCSEATRLVAWLRSRGIPAESIARDEHAELKSWADINGDAVAREVIELRREAGRNSTAKFKRMREVVCDDGRARGLLLYHRALTGRWGGALVQPHNLPRVDETTELPGVLDAIVIMEDVYA